MNNNRVLNIDEIASIRNKYHKELDDKFRKENTDEELHYEPEQSDEESDISIIIINDREYYKDLDNNVYKIKNDNQIGELINTELSK